MLSDADRNLIMEANQRLAKGMQDAVSQGIKELKEELEKLSSDGDKDQKDNTKAVEENTKEFVKTKAVLVATLTKIGSTVVSFASKVGGEMNAFGNTLARSAAATGRDQLLGTRRLEDGVSRAEASISKAAGEFGLAPSQFAGLIDSAIRANIRDTGKQTQKFIATAAGLGTGIGSLNKFLATQTNVLGSSTEASIEFGNTILELAASNGILGDSILDAVAAFTRTAQKQSVIFGPEVSDSIQKGLAGLTTALPNLDIASLVGSLTAPENIVRLPAIAGQLGIAAPDETDPEGMVKFIAEAIEGLAAQTEGRSGIELERLLAGLQGAMGETFSLENVFKAQRASRVAAEKGTDILSIMTQQVDPQEAAKRQADAARSIGEASSEAMENMLLFSTTLAGLNDKAGMQGKVLDSLVPAMDEVSDSLGSMIGTATGLDNALKVVTLSLYGLASSLLFSAAPSVIPAVGRAGSKLIGKAFTGTQSGLAKGLTKAGMKPRSALSPGMNKVMSSKLLRGAGKLAAPLGGVIAAGSELAETGDKSRAAVRGVATTGGAVGGASAGALAGAPLGPIGALAGAIIGGIAGSLLADKTATAVHDVFDEDFKSSQMSREIQQAQGVEAPPSTPTQVSDPNVRVSIDQGNTEIVEELQRANTALENLPAALQGFAGIPSPPRELMRFPTTRSKVEASALD
jgi:gas vesicle protein